jgi:hypothetical protein
LGEHAVEVDGVQAVASGAEGELPGIVVEPGADVDDVFHDEGPVGTAA